MAGKPAEMLKGMVARREFDSRHLHQSSLIDSEIVVAYDVTKDETPDVVVKSACFGGGVPVSIATVSGDRQAVRRMT